MMESKIHIHLGKYISKPRHRRTNVDMRSRKFIRIPFQSGKCSYQASIAFVISSTTENSIIIVQTWLL